MLYCCVAVDIVWRPVDKNVVVCRNVVVMKSIVARVVSVHNILPTLEVRCHRNLPGLKRLFRFA